MRLHLLELGLFSDGTPVSAALIQTGDGRSLLVDTGCPPLHEPWPEDDRDAAGHLAGCRRALLHDFGAADAEAMLHGLGVRLPDRLAAMGLAARDVTRSCARTWTPITPAGTTSSATPSCGSSAGSTGGRGPAPIPGSP